MFANKRKAIAVKVNKSSILVILLCLRCLVGCQEGTVNNAENAEFERCNNVIMAQTHIEFGEYKDYIISLIMNEGVYYTEEQTVPGGGTYKENYVGQYVLQLQDANESVIEEKVLNDEWGTAEINFPGPFTLYVDDYNKDKSPDFIIGTYGSSSMNIFRIYTIGNQGKIINIGEFSDISKEFSLCLEQKEDSSDFYAIIWNNAIGEEEKIQYKWCVEEERYIQ